MNVTDQRDLITRALNILEAGGTAPCGPLYTEGITDSLRYALEDHEDGLCPAADEGRECRAVVSARTILEANP